MILSRHVASWRASPSMAPRGRAAGPIALVGGARGACAGPPSPGDSSERATPGGAVVLIAPETAGLGWARGRVPTPNGLVEVEWQVAGRRWTGAATAPRGTRLVASEAIRRGARARRHHLEWSVPAPSNP